MLLKKLGFKSTMLSWLLLPLVLKITAQLFTFIDKVVKQCDITD